MSEAITRKHLLFEFDARLPAMTPTATAEYLRETANRIDRGDLCGVGWNTHKRHTQTRDWEALKRCFVESGRMTLNQFARKHGIDYGHVRNMASAGLWRRTRLRVQAGAATEEGIALCDVCKRAIKGRANLCCAD